MFIESLRHQATKRNSPSTRHKIVHRKRHSGASNTSVANTACDHGILDTLLPDLNVCSTALSLCVRFFFSRIKESRGSHRTALCFQRYCENVTLLNWHQDTPWRKSTSNLHKKTETKVACDTFYIPRKINIVATFKGLVEMHRTELCTTTWSFTSGPSTFPCPWHFTLQCFIKFFIKKLHVAHYLRAPLFINFRSSESIIANLGVPVRYQLSEQEGNCWSLLERSVSMAEGSHTVAIL